MPKAYVSPTEEVVARLRRAERAGPSHYRTLFQEAAQEIEHLVNENTDLATTLDECKEALEFHGVPLRNVDE